MHQDPVPLMAEPTIVAISDFRDGWPPAGDPEPSAEEARQAWQEGRYAPPPGGPPLDRNSVAVLGGYLERLPLACIRAGLVDRAEIWHHWRPADPGPFRRDSDVLARRCFRLGDEAPPFRSQSMLGFLQAYGAPHILCIWGLGVDEAILQACENSLIVYNSIDAPALRVPESVSRHVDLVITAAEWQSEVVRERHPDMACAVLPIGPEFGDPETFRPLGIAKPYDVIYVAAAQGYKRHDVLFEGLARAPRRLRALCVFGYGELADELRGRAAALGLDVDFVGPPGVPFHEVNHLMNQAKVGVVCGVEDGAPAILTEYMLAGLPVLANAHLRCGLQYILPETGLAAEADRFGEALCTLVDAAPRMQPREAVLARWTWPHSVQIFAQHLRNTRKGRTTLAAIPQGASARLLDK